ncbi:MAG: DUF6265 family protein [Phycisphaerales bacterium]
MRPIPLAAFLLSSACVCSPAMLVGCASTPVRPAAHGAEAPVDAAIAPLAFMQGNWVLSQPNGATIEEHWQAPRGKALLGSFRRVLGNGITPFYEFTQIVAEKDRVVLRQIHVHGNFDTDPRRAEPMVLVMEKCSASMATFVPAKDGANAGALARVTYSAPDRSTLLLVVEPRQEAGKPVEKPLEFRMKRAG